MPSLLLEETELEGSRVLSLRDGDLLPLGEGEVYPFDRRRARIDLECEVRILVDTIAPRGVERQSDSIGCLAKELGGGLREALTIGCLAEHLHDREVLKA